jgi:hypothetical protein
MQVPSSTSTCHIITGTSTLVNVKNARTIARATAREAANCCARFTRRPSGPARRVVSVSLADPCVSVERGVTVAIAGREGTHHLDILSGRGAAA